MKLRKIVFEFDVGEIMENIWGSCEIFKCICFLFEKCFNVFDLFRKIICK